MPNETTFLYDPSRISNERVQEIFSEVLKSKDDNKVLFDLTINELKQPMDFKSVLSHDNVLSTLPETFFVSSNNNLVGSAVLNIHDIYGADQAKLKELKAQMDIEQNLLLVPNPGNAPGPGIGPGPDEGDLTAYGEQAGCTSNHISSDFDIYFHRVNEDENDPAC